MSGDELFTITLKQGNEILLYLTSRPYREVFQLVDIMRNLKPVEKEEVPLVVEHNQD